MKYIDLHTHSVCSDGSMTPEEVVRAARDAGLSAIALSDHDTTEGVARAMAEGRRLGVEVIPAIELSAASETETHILGYYIDPESPALLRKIDYIRAVRARREEEICRRLCELGMPVTMEEVLAEAMPHPTPTSSPSATSEEVLAEAMPLPTPTSSPSATSEEVLAAAAGGRSPDSAQADVAAASVGRRSTEFASANLAAVAAGRRSTDSAQVDVAAASVGRRSICRIHIAQVMIRRGYVSSVREAFDRWLASGKPAYSPTQALTDEEAVRLIKDAGGLAFVAHLNQTRRSTDSLYGFLARLKSVGLDGVEGYYTEYTPEMQRDYQALAGDLGLLISGGSDFHGKNKDIRLGELCVPYDVLEAMKARLARG